MMQTKRLWITVSAVLLVLTGLVYILLPRVQAAIVRHQGDQQNAGRVTQAAQTVTPETKTAMTFGQPQSLTLPRLGLTLQITQGYYQANSQTWTLDSQHAFIMQSPTNEAMTTPVIYGHNIPAVFRKLDGVAKDEVLRITTQDGRELLFRYTGDQVVMPDDESVLHADLHNTLLLMTCTGSQFQHRRVLQFEYLGSNQISVAPAEGNYERLA